MSTILIRMTGAALFPVLICVLFYQAEKNKRYAALPYMVKQLMIGVVFGGAACLATEFGIPANGATLNVRDAAPLAAGLVFGWPSGLIAGLIGGIERWFSVLWGAGEYTRLACTLGTILAGIIGASVRRFMMDNKKASWFYGLAVGIAVEVLHMLLVFLTHVDELHRAFEVVMVCALPMITANSVSVMLCILSVVQLSNRREESSHQVRKIAQSFQRWLLLCVVLAFLVTSAFTGFLQSRLADSTAGDTLKLNLEDVKEEIRAASDKHLLELTRQIAAELNGGGETQLSRLASKYGVTEINLVDSEGMIVSSTYPGFVGYNMASGTQSRAFLPLLAGSNQVVQRYQPTSSDSAISRKYAGVPLESGGFVQVGYDAQQFQKDISEQVVSAAKNRHIGQDGFITICNEAGLIVSDRDGHEGEYIPLPDQDEAELPAEFTIFRDTVYGTSSFCMYTQSEGYYLIAVLPASEALFARNVSVYILAFMETLVFATLFAQIYFLIKKLVVENIQKVNDSLAQITGGNLNVTVNVRSNEEFASLSDDINTTVDTLKRYIDEAAARIDRELEFARKIQHAALPSVFPPYPMRKDFSIYATMDTAKEVGGDFYDFYLLGEDKLAFLIADVSGKGIPAAMFMMTAKTLIKGLAETGLEVHEIFTQANAKLCQGNEAEMFVTAWMGILDLKTGLLQYANAGHNPPALRERNGAYHFLKCRPNLVLAGMDGIRYRKNELLFRPGDQLFLYTDGVTESQNTAQELWGDDRLLQSLNENAALSVEALCKKVKSDVDRFAGEADQFDDITMLCLSRNQPE